MAPSALTEKRKGPSTISPRVVGRTEEHLPETFAQSATWRRLFAAAA